MLPGVKKLSIPAIRSASRMPSSFRWQVRSFSLTSKWTSRLSSRAIRSASEYLRTSSKAGPEMISGVRASSIRMLSTSSMIA